MKTISVQSSSLNDLMSNAFRGQEEIPPERKLHLGRDGKTLILPAANIMGFLTSTLVGRSCVNTFVPPKERPNVKAEVLASVAIRETEIPILADGKPILFSGFNDKVYVDERPAQASKTSRDIVRRPVVRMPWQVNFTLLLNETEYVTEARMHDWFVQGGIMVGLGAFRPFFGKFEVTRWEVS
jgi:hypothetical protein